MDARAFYDEYVGRQVAVGVNERHRSILRWLRRFGLREGQRVLEIGSGVGTLTELLAGELGGEGRLVGVDLSPRSIEAARERLSGFDNVRLLAGDALELDIDGPFDVVVLPDVLEHIPVEEHPDLFGRIAGWTAEDGFVLLHYPAPLFTRWLHRHRPDLLQVIDQEIELDRLVPTVYRHGLYVEHLETYSIWVPEGDYQAVVLRPDPEEPRITLEAGQGADPSLLRRILGKLLP